MSERKAAVGEPSGAPAARRLPRLTFAHLELLVALAAVVVAALPLSTFYGSPGWLPAVGGAVLLGGATGALAAARRWRAALTGLVSVVVAALYALYVGYPARTWYGLPGPAAWRALGTGAGSGWARMLTVGLPADVTGDMVTTPVLAGFAAGLAVALLALRTRLVTVLTLPPLALFTAAVAVTASRPGRWALLVAAVLPVLLLLLLLRSNRVAAADAEGIASRDAEAIGVDLAARRWHSTVGRVAFGLPVVAIVGALGVVGAATLPIAAGADRADPRDLHHEQFRLAPGLTPLVQVKPQLEASPSELFRVRVTQRGGSYPVDRVRVATLDSFDGALWTESRDFLVAGSTLPAGPALSGPAVQVQLDVDVTRLPQPFLPVVGRPVHVSGADLAFDPVNGTLVSTRPAVSGYSYRVVGEVRPQAGIGQAAAPTDMAQYTQLPDPPAWVNQLADDITRDWQTPWTQLSAIEKYLRGKGYALSARPGHSYGAVYRTLEGPPEDQAGYAEQYASAFAILARAKGYAARVAVGYRLQQQKRTGDTYRVDNTDAHAWPEVFLSGYGWVPFEPTNTGNPATSKPPRDSTAPVLPDDPRTEQPREPQQDNAQAATEAGGGGESVGRTALLVGVLLLLIPVLLVVLVVLAKAQRRMRRRRRGPPSVRIAAAWREVTDRLRERGTAVPGSATPVEVARSAREGRSAPAAPGLDELALIATTSVCAPDEPPPQAADRAWELAAGIRRSLDSATPLPVRLRALVDPRPLLPRRRRPARPADPPRADAREPVAAGAGRSAGGAHADRAGPSGRRRR